MWQLIQSKLMATVGAGVLFCGLLLAAYKVGVIQGKSAQQLIATKEQAANNDYWAKVVNRLNTTQAKKDKDNEIKYRGLESEIVKFNTNLRKCKLNLNSMRIIYKSANVQTPSSASRNVDTNAGKPTDNLPSMTCQDLSETLIAHDKLYFEAKYKLDFFQSIWTK